MAFLVKTFVPCLVPASTFLLYQTKSRRNTQWMSLVMQDGNRCVFFAPAIFLFLYSEKENAHVTDYYIQWQPTKKDSTGRRISTIQSLRHRWFVANKRRLSWFSPCNGKFYASMPWIDRKITRLFGHWSWISMRFLYTVSWYQPTRHPQHITLSPYTYRRERLLECQWCWYINLVIPKTRWTRITVDLWWAQWPLVPTSTKQQWNRMQLRRSYHALVRWSFQERSHST